MSCGVKTQTKVLQSYRLPDPPPAPTVTTTKYRAEVEVTPCGRPSDAVARSGKSGGPFRMRWQTRIGPGHRSVSDRATPGASAYYETLRLAFEAGDAKTAAHKAHDAAMRLRGSHGCMIQSIDIRVLEITETKPVCAAPASHGPVHHGVRRRR